MYEAQLPSYCVQKMSHICALTRRCDFDMQLAQPVCSVHSLHYVQRWPSSLICHDWSVGALILSEVQLIADRQQHCTHIAISTSPSL